MCACCSVLVSVNLRQSIIHFFGVIFRRYGYTPLPKTISQESFDEHLTNVPPSEEIQKLLQKWYILDDNSEPADYVLEDLKTMNDKSFWDEALPKLTKYFDGVSEINHCQI